MKLTWLWKRKNLQALADTALECSFDECLALKEAYRDLAKAARTVDAFLSMPNQCETCRLRVRNSLYCDASDCVKHHAVRCMHYEDNGE